MDKLGGMLGNVTTANEPQHKDRTVYPTLQYST